LSATQQMLVNLDVPDLEAATRFYVGAFGLSVGRRLGQAALELLGAAVPIYLIAKPEGSEPFGGATYGRSYRRHWTPVHLDFAVPDVDAARTRALAHGASAEGDVSEHVWGRMALMADPFGHGFCLLEFKGRGYDEITTADP
jgi:predicted enzyme related to lactoylglutathione lyase